VDPLRRLGNEAARSRKRPMVKKPKVHPGECIDSIAACHGLSWETLWNDPVNGDLRAKRESPNILQAGDEVGIPELRPKTEDAATEARTRFRRKGVPSRLRLVLVDSEGKVRSNVKCRLDVDGHLSEIETDAQGLLKTTISPLARHGRLFVPSGDRELAYDLELGGLDPPDTASGARHRLENLGIHAGESDEDLRRALLEYQRRAGLEPTGQLDETTVQTLQDEHGS